MWFFFLFCCFVTWTCNFVSLSTLPTYYSPSLNEVILYFKNINEGLVLKLYIKAKVLVYVCNYTELAYRMVLESIHYYSLNMFICLGRRTCKIQNQWHKILIDRFLISISLQYPINWILNSNIVIMVGQKKIFYDLHQTLCLFYTLRHMVIYRKFYILGLCYGSVKNIFEVNERTFK